MGVHDVKMGSSPWSFARVHPGFHCYSLSASLFPVRWLSSTRRVEINKGWVLGPYSHYVSEGAGAMDGDCGCAQRLGDCAVVFPGVDVILMRWSGAEQMSSRKRREKRERRESEGRKE